MALIINKKTLLDSAPIKNMATEKLVAHGMSYGLSEAGYDIRIKQRIVFEPGDYIMLAERNCHIRTACNLSVDGVDQIHDRICLGSSIEEFDMPADMVGKVFNKSSWARLGVDASKTTIIEPGWKGFLTLEIKFDGDLPVIIEAGAPIAQIIFEHTVHSAPYQGKYQNQPDKPVPTRKEL